MKIVIVGTAYPFRGGLATFNERLARQFQAEGHEVVMETFTLQYPSFLFPGKSQYSESAPPGDLKIERSFSSVNPISWFKSANKIAEFNPDIVIFAYWMSFMAPCFGTIARRVKAKCNAKCYALVHNMLPHEQTLLDKFLPSYFVRTIDGFIALSKSVAKDISLIDKQGKPILFSPHPIYDHYGSKCDKNVAAKKLNLDPSVNYLLFFGFIRSYKGVDLLLQALADERLSEFNCKVIVAGEFYEDEKYYYDLEKKLGLKGRVIWYPSFIPDGEVAPYFNVADMVILPYKSATQSGVAQIAYHFEKPMVVTNVGGLPEIVPNKKVGFVVDVNPKAIATAIAGFYTETNSLNFEAGIAEEKKKYEWTKLTQSFVELFNETSIN
ncbi:MAG: glycosyltransferase [Paludibacteraceae bacterium]|nr:glycosyltransferase [Paludibacteraceae bacterium]